MTAQIARTGRELQGAAGLIIWLAGVREALARHREYLATLAELRSLTDRELSDIGMNRSMIREVAREAIYGR